MFGDLDAEEYTALQNQADLETLNNGITFTVYSDQTGIERIFPFSLVPRNRRGQQSGRLLSAGPQAAHQCAQSVPHRCVWRCEMREGRG